MNCQSCRNALVRIGWAEADLRAAARKAVHRPNDRNIAHLNWCKEQVTRAKEIAAQHELACEQVAAADLTVP